jgi:sugar diacid utilization regulator
VRELQEVIEALAERLGRAVAVDDPSIRLLAHTAHDEQVDEHRVHSIMTLRAGGEITDYVFSLGIRTATQPVRIPGREDLRMLGRVCFPVRCQGLLLGFLWLIDDDGSLTDEDFVAAAAAADAAGEALFRARLLDDLHRAREQQLVFDLVAPDAKSGGSVTQADLDAVGLTGQLGCRVLVVDAPCEEGLDETEAADLSIESVLRRNLRKVRHVRSLVATRRGGHGLALVAYRTYNDPLDELRAVAESISDELKATLPSPSDVLVGVGPAAPTVLDAGTSHQRALGVVDVCRKVRDFAPVAAWEDVGIYRLLQQLPLAELVDVAIPPGLQTLIDAESDQWLIGTLDTYLDTAGNVQESAKALHIHRATLYYRLSRIEELTGMSLANGADRLALHLGVKIGRLTGAITAHSGPAKEPPSGRSTDKPEADRKGDHSP